MEEIKISTTRAETAYEIPVLPTRSQTAYDTPVVKTARSPKGARHMDTFASDKNIFQT